MKPAAPVAAAAPSIFDDIDMANIRSNLVHHSHDESDLSKIDIRLHQHYQSSLSMSMTVYLGYDLFMSQITLIMSRLMAQTYLR